MEAKIWYILISITQVKKVSLSKKESLTIFGYGELGPEVLANETLINEGQVIRSSTNKVQIHYRSLRQTNHGIFSLQYQGNHPKSQLLSKNAMYEGLWYVSNNKYIFVPVSFHLLSIHFWLSTYSSLPPFMHVPSLSWGRGCNSNRHSSGRSGPLPLWSRVSGQGSRGSHLPQHDTSALEFSWTTVCGSVVLL